VFLLLTCLLLFASVFQAQLFLIVVSTGKMEREEDEICFRYIIHHPLFESHCLSMKIISREGS